ncbi:MAG: copper chaperone PCu(A)C [Porticoccaceae bacterium]|nr:copper chaperone PCu(A)C [Porticoccaceae bacterium]
MEKIITLLLILVAQASLVAPLAQSSSLQASDSYIRTMPPGLTTTAGFLSITNSGSTPCLLLSAESQLSDRLEFHEHLHSDGMMRMRPVTGGINVPAGETVVFKPGGLHIMLFNIQQPLIAGESTRLQFNTDQCGILDISAEIRSLVAKPMGGMHH